MTKLARSLEQYANVEPRAVAEGSAAQVMYFVEDAKKDIASLAATAANAGEWSAEWHGRFVVASAALQKLVNEVSGFAGFGPEVEALIGVTNWNVLLLRVQEARDVLASNEAPL